jgi:hypothetical protein
MKRTSNSFQRLKRPLYVWVIVLLALQGGSNLLSEVAAAEIVTEAATIYYVSPAGNDDNSGTSPGEAWKTIAKVNSMRFNAGDQILFERGGVWHEALVVSSSGLPGNPIAFGSYGSGEKPTFDGDYSIWEMVLIGGNDHLVFRDLTFTHTQQHVIKTGSLPSSNILIENCNFIENAGAAISAASGSENWIVRNNHISGCDRAEQELGYEPCEGGCDSIYINSGARNWEISHNTIRDSCGDAISPSGSGHHIYQNILGPNTSESIGVSPDSGSDDIWIYDNKIFGHDWCGIVVKGTNFKIFRNEIYDNGIDGGIFTNNENVQGLEIYQNLIYDHHNDPGIVIWRGGDYTQIYNNVIINNESGIAIQQNQEGIAFINNIIYSNANIGIDTNGTYGTIWNNDVYQNGIDYAGIEDQKGINYNISQDPLLINETERDFHLQNNSPCIDAGVDVGLDDDFEGTLIPQGVYPDMGAYESGTSSHENEDLNQDGVANILDLQLGTNVFLGAVQDPAVVGRADINHDGLVDNDDLEMVIIKILQP